MSDGLPPGPVYSERVLHTKRQEQPQFCAVQGKRLSQQHAQWSDVCTPIFEVNSSTVYGSSWSFVLSFAVKQRAVVRATWTPVIPQIRERGVALQPWPTAPHHVITPPKKVPQPLHLRHKRNPKFHSITPNTNPAPPQPLVQ